MESNKTWKITRLETGLVLGFTMLSQTQNPHYHLCTECFMKAPRDSEIYPWSDS